MKKGSQLLASEESTHQTQTNEYAVNSLPANHPISSLFSFVDHFRRDGTHQIPIKMLINCKKCFGIKGTNYWIVIRASVYLLSIYWWGKMQIMMIKWFNFSCIYHVSRAFIIKGRNKSDSKYEIACKIGLNFTIKILHFHRNKCSMLRLKYFEWCTSYCYFHK